MTTPDVSTVETPDTGGEPGISETIADIPGRKRGRPGVVPPEVAAFLRGRFPSECRTERGLQQVYYRTKACRLLKDRPEYTWLVDEAAIRSGQEAWRPVLLAELGRIDDEDELCEAAAMLCEAKPKTTDGVVWLRRWRSGDRSPLIAVTEETKLPPPAKVEAWAACAEDLERRWQEAIDHRETATGKLEDDFDVSDWNAIVAAVRGC